MGVSSGDRGWWSRRPPRPRRGGTASASVSVSTNCFNGQVTHTSVTDFAACALTANTIATQVDDGEVRLAGSIGDDYAVPVLNPALWVSGSWTDGPYTPTITNGVLSIANSSGGAYVRSAAAMSPTTLEASARFGAAPWLHLGWGSLNFDPAYAIFSTYNTTTNLFARTSPGGSEQRTDLGPIPSGFHIYRISRQAASATTDVVSYYIDGALKAQHSVAKLPTASRHACPEFDHALGFPVVFTNRTGPDAAWIFCLSR
jgi:hypothetical protein